MREVLQAMLEVRRKVFFLAKPAEREGKTCLLSKLRGVVKVASGYSYSNGGLLT